MFKFDTLYFSCSPADLEFHINVTVGKRIFQVFPTISFGQFFFQCLVYLVLCLVVGAQAFLFDMVFTIGKVQAIFGGQHFADFLIPTEIVLVANRLAVIIHSVENDMTMRMLTVDMPGNDVFKQSRARRSVASAQATEIISTETPVSGTPVVPPAPPSGTPNVSDSMSEGSQA